ncbi:MAG: tRNA pseudouridine(55) synthase TruB [Treponema sp.]|jgi:tRNA pseudouridine55 synthase|nr:tRNA pseudouridine(55) synthase TruB [Treponema sp.]
MQSGLILINKKTGVTSFQALGEIKRALGTGKVGHTGTLDKFASGLLVVLAGSALKLAPWFSHCDKQYEGRICFGVETDTLDPEGSVIAESAVPVREKVEQALSQFKGKILQEPPIFSAIHVNGRRASSLARSGEKPEMKKRPVEIYKLELRGWEPPFADIFVHCSSGTYIRSLARDIALAAGSRAHLCALTRTRVASFTLDMSGKDISPLPITKTVIAALGLPYFEITLDETEKLIHGKPLEPILEGKELFSQGETSPATESFSAAVFAGETLAAIVERSTGGWKYRCVIGH